MSGLFGTFNIAKKGMFVQQKAIDVTSHNIANANTEGYSRQRAKIETTRPFCTPSVNNAVGPGQLGTGSQIAAIERIRDSFLDYQVRTELSNYAKYDNRYKFLSEIESIMNEPTDTGVSNLMSEFYSSWQELAKKPESSNARTVVAHQAEALSNALNHTYNQLNKLKDNAHDLIKENVFDINGMLNQIDSLNQEIMAVKVAGNMPNDLMDKRDLLLDQLSNRFGITIEKSNYEGINLKADGMNLNLIKAVDNKKDVYRLSYVDSIKNNGDGTYDITYYKFGDKQSAANKETLTVPMTADEFKKLDDSRVIWSGLDGKAVVGKDNKLAAFQPASGELSGLASVQDDMNKYIDQLNSLAKALAWSVNAIHIKDVAEDDQMLFFVKNDNNKSDDINAGNIAVNSDLMKDVMKINVGKDKAAGESDNSRALAIAGLKDALLMIQDIGSTVKSRTEFIKDPGGFENGGFFIANNVQGMKMDTYFKNTVSTLGVQCQEAKRGVKNKLDLLDSFSESRMSVSGVSLDEEMANLIQFQHAYQANAKIIATVDQLLDLVVNGLKR